MAITTQAKPLERRETSNLIGSDKVEGTPVRRPDGERVGQIERIMIDKLSGKVAYAVMSCGGFLGMGEDYYPLPWSVLKYNPTLGGYEISVTEQQLKMPRNIPGTIAGIGLTAHERGRLATSTVFDPHPLGVQGVQGEKQKGESS